MSPGTLQLKPAGWKEFLRWFMGWRKRFKVEGYSMLPLLKPGDVIFVKKTASVALGDVAVFRHPIQSDLILVKQVIKMKKDRLQVEGLNPASSDSRAWGSVPLKNLLGSVSSVL